MALIPKKAKKDEAASKKKGPTKTDGEPLSGMVMYNGAMLDIDSVLQRLEKSEKSSADLETKLDELTNDKGKYSKTYVKLPLKNTVDSEIFARVLFS